MSGSAQDGSSGSARRGAGGSAGVGVRSSSAIDLQAAQRAKARAQYAALARHKVGSGASLPRPRKSSDAGIGSLTTSAATSPERVGRTRSRVAGVSQSQPSSRSGSPSSRLSYATYSARMEAARGGGGSGDATDSGRPRRLTGIPRSTGASREASRETSPSRFGPAPFGSKLSCRGRSLAGLERPSVRPVMAQKILQQSREAESAIADALTCDSLESGDYARGGHTRKRLFDDHSDDSETSSVCSERSFDSYRRPSDFQLKLDISEIIANCASTHWGDRKEGLVGLLVFLQTGQLLRPNELQLVTEIFTKMFMDSHTKVFSLFLDTLWELLQAHRADLNDWLYVLLTRLLNKLGTDLLNSIHTKIQRLLAHVREAFPPDLQLACVLRFLTDATQTPNARVRTATLTHLTALCAACGDPAAMPTRPPAPAALAKIVSLAADSKQPGEVRRAARGALVAMFDLAAPQVAMMLAELPQEFQEIASPLLQSHLRRSSGGGGGGTGGSPPSPGRASPSGALSSPGTPQTPRQTALASRAIGAEEEDLNPEEVYRSLRRTTAEIQSYPFGDAAPGTGNMGNAPTALGGKLPDRDRDTTSQDSGISQMSAGAGDKLDALEEHFEALSLTRNNSILENFVAECTFAESVDSNPTLVMDHYFHVLAWWDLSEPQFITINIHFLLKPPPAWMGRSSSLSSPTHRLNSLKDYNGIDADSSLGHTENGFLSRESQEDSEALRKALEIVRPQDSPNGTEVPLTASTARRDAFYTLQTLAKEANAAALTEHFKVLLRVLLELLGRPDEPQRGAVLGVLSELLLRREVAPGFNKYVELLVLKVLEAYKEYSKDVPRMAELCSASVGAVLPPDTVIRVLNPLITTGDFPVNLGAIKMLMKAYNNEESSVRKSAVFCMVALHNALGEAALQPHLAALSGSKLKLLNLYIRRAQSGSGSGGGGGGGSGSSGNASAPTSPKNNQAP
ncbi:CLIP-associating protein [Gryllus bimaculatus]|nr:CLIP-associating protein [Gryllus bimaculatus]